MLYVMKDTEENNQAADDACKLIDAWEVRRDRKRYQKATAFIKAQSCLFATFVQLQEAEMSDPFD